MKRIEFLGTIAFRTEDEAAVVEAPGAVFIQRGATTRSMEAKEPSLVLAVLCRHEGPFLANGRPEGKA